MRSPRLPPRREAAQKTQPPRGSIDRVSVRYATALGIATLAAVDAAFGRMPLAVLGVYVVLALVSAGLYIIDKRRAQAGEWRISEATLHGVDLIGGIAGGLVAQEAIRHKTAKRPFVTVTYAIAALHVLGLLALAAGVLSLDTVQSLLATLT